MNDWIDLEPLQISTDVLACVPRYVAFEELVLPIFIEDETLVVAVADASKQECRDKLRFILNRELKFVTAPVVKLKFAIWRYYGNQDFDQEIKKTRR